MVKIEGSKVKNDKIHQKLCHTTNFRNLQDFTGHTGHFVASLTHKYIKFDSKDLFRAKKLSYINSEFFNVADYIQMQLFNRLYRYACWLYKK